MSFFEDTTVTELVQSTIDDVKGLTDQEQEKLLVLFRNTRRELQDRLFTIPEGTFTETQLNITLVQVNAAIDAITRDLKSQMSQSSSIFSEKGVLDSETQVNIFTEKFEGAARRLPINRIVIAQKADTFLLNKHAASIEAYSSQLKSQIVSNITQSMALGDTQQRTVSRIVGDVGKFFLGEEWKIVRIARTEFSNIYNFSKLSTLDELSKREIPDIMKTLFHPMDSRTADDSKKLSKENPIKEIDEPFIFKYKDKTRTFLFPPDRPGDRSVLVPYRKVWDK